MNGDHEKENIGEEQFDSESDHSREELFEELIEMEEKLIGEALNLIEHGLSLVDKKDYDDAIDILRQALGLYDQIGRINEMNLIRKKISEIYILKEQAVIEAPEKEIVISESNSEIVMEEKDQLESVESIELLAKEKLEQAKNLIDIYEFDEAILIYDNAIQLYRKMNNDSKIEGVYELIDKCYAQKAKFLIHGPKGEVSEAKMKSVPETAIEPVSVEQKKFKADGVRVKTIKEFEELKLREQLISNRAYELIEKASKLADVYDFERATKLFNDAINYFKDINWEHEIKKIQKLIEHLEKDKEDFLHKVEEKREKDEKRRELEAEKVALLENKAMKIRELEEKDRMKRIEELEKKKQDKEAFQKEITEMVDKAERIAREYEVGIKHGNFDLECQYPKVIEIYTDIHKKLINRGWTDQSIIYKRQIEIYQEKLEKDRKLREVEAGKIEKQREYEEMLKFRKEKPKISTDVGSSTLDKYDYKKEFKKELIQKEISSLVDKAIRLAREYESAIRRGNTEMESPYPEIIEIYTKVRDIVLESGLNDQAERYNKQIQFYRKKL